MTILLELDDPKKCRDTQFFLYILNWANNSLLGKVSNVKNLNLSQFQVEKNMCYVLNIP
jgi:hypothetical protein